MDMVVVCCSKVLLLESWSAVVIVLRWNSMRWGIVSQGTLPVAVINVVLTRSWSVPVNASYKKSKPKP